MKRLNEKGKYSVCEETAACIDCITFGYSYLLLISEVE